jgi:hypothetical protein
LNRCRLDIVLTSLVRRNAVPRPPSRQKASEPQV